MHAAARTKLFCQHPAGTLAHVAEVMAPGGFLCFYDFMDVTPALFWGLSEQCWGFEDERDYSLWCSFSRWDRLLTDAGFEQARTWPCALGELGLARVTHLHICASMCQ